MTKETLDIPEVMTELKELITDADSSTDIDKASAEYAQIFLDNLFKVNKYASPDLELQPDSETAITFRNDQGILNIAFNNQGYATFAAYFPCHEETYKGRFQIDKTIPENVLFLIGLLS